MAVAFDVATSSLRTTVTAPWTWTHTPTGTPRGVVVAVINRASATDNVTAVDYGGVALTRIVRATDSATETGAADLWFVGSGIPTGAQTVTATLASATTEDIEFVSITLTGGANLEVVDFDSINDDATNPQVTLQYGGRTCLAICAAFNGANDPTITLTSLAGQTNDARIDFGTTSAVVDHQTTAGSSDFTIGYTAGAEDNAFVAIAVSEVQAGGSAVTSPYYAAYYYPRMVAA